MQGLTSEALTTLAAGETLEDEFDIAATSDLSHGGPVVLRSSGLVPLVNDGVVSGYLPYHSNDLKIDVDADKAASVSKAVRPLSRRTHESCSNASRKSALERALRNTASLATAAAKAAQSGSSSKFAEYFKTTSSSTRSVVAARLQAVAREAQSTTSGGTTYYCTDVLGYCETNVLAYTLPSQNIIANCDIYYSDLPALASRCHAQDQATTSLHEFTHAPAVYSPGTDDLGYGYSAATSLSTNDALNNADTYALYANGEFNLPFPVPFRISRLSKTDQRDSDLPWLLDWVRKRDIGCLSDCVGDGGRCSNREEVQSGRGWQQFRSTESHDCDLLRILPFQSKYMNAVICATLNMKEHTNGFSLRHNPLSEKA